MEYLIAVALHPVGTASLIQVVLLGFAMLSALWALFVYPWRHWLKADRVEHRPAVLRTIAWGVLAAGLAGAGMFAGALEDAEMMQVAMTGPLFGAGVGYFIANRSAVWMLRDFLPAPTGTNRQ